MRVIFLRKIVVNKERSALLFALLSELTNKRKYHMSHNTQTISFNTQQQHYFPRVLPLRLIAILSIFTTAIVAVTRFGATVTLNRTTDAR